MSERRTLTRIRAVLASVGLCGGIASCGASPPVAHTAFAFHPGPSQPTVLAQADMHALFGLVYGADYPIGNVRVLLRDLARGTSIDVFGSTDLRGLRRLRRRGTIGRLVPFARRGDRTAYLALVTTSHKKSFGRAFIRTVLGSGAYLLREGFTPLPLRPRTGSASLSAARGRTLAAARRTPARARRRRPPGGG